MVIANSTQIASSAIGAHLTARHSIVTDQARSRSGEVSRRKATEANSQRTDLAASELAVTRFTGL